ncbi:MAG: DNA mismatch repair endonuclease MutL, partial [Aggregatilineales bacterium]
MTVQKLADDVIAQIAAGEVVERPASVVKELLENALDAGADSIHIEVSEGGKRLIRISDNGSGIYHDEVMLALERHATSKLRHADDLYHIQTLGFRGEALASIASISHTTLSTRHRDEDIGTQVRIEGAKLVNQKAVGVPAGTVLTIENLFYNVPARLKFLKSENTEKRHIQMLVTRYAMAYPGVRFTLIQDGREVFRSNGSGQLADVIVKILGLDYFKEMVEVAGEERIPDRSDFIRVQGFVSAPTLHRKDRTRIVLFINGRAIQDTNLTYAVVQAYHTLMDKGRYPIAVLMIEMPTDFVDVNVHPAKAEVRFRDANAVFVAVQRTIRQTVIGLNTPTGMTIPPENPSTHETWQTAYRPKMTRQNTDISDDINSDERPGYFPELSLTEDDIAGAEIPVGAGSPRKPRTLPPLRVVGQVGAAYIVAEGPAGMYLIDQRAAHERILFEQLKEQYDNDCIVSVTLENSATI